MIQVHFEIVFKSDAILLLQHLQQLLVQACLEDIHL